MTARDLFLIFGTPAMFLVAGLVVYYLAKREADRFDREHPRSNKQQNISGEPDSMVLRFLQQIDEKLDRVVADIADLKVRVAALESIVTVVNERLDRIGDRLERIEQRLELVETKRST